MTGEYQGVWGGNTDESSVVARYWYFESSRILAPGDPSPDDARDLFPLGAEAVALGQRIACKCEELGLSIEPASHLYVCLTSALKDGGVRQVEFAPEKWQRFEMYGLGAEIVSR